MSNKCDGCDNCDQWPCRCVPQEGDDAPQEEAVPQEAVSVAEGGTDGSASDATDTAGVHSVPVRQAQETDVAPVQEAAPVEVCWVCGKPGIQGQPFSGGKEFYCPHCDDVHPYRRETSDPITDILAELKRANAGGVVVAHRPDENLDDTVAEMIAAGWTLGETVHVGGKRIRYLTRPGVSDEGQQADGEAHS